MPKSFFQRLPSLVLLLASLPLHADHGDVSALPLFELAAPSFTSYTIHDGLPASVMANVMVDDQGFVLAGTANNIVRYDGSRWESDTPYARNGTLGTFTVTHDGTLWVAFRDNGIARFDGKQWQADETLPPRFVRRVVETSIRPGEHQLWALSTHKGLWMKTRDQWQEAPGNSALPKTLLSMTSTQTLFGKPRLWVGSGIQGLWFSEGNGDWKRYEAAGFDATQIESLLVTHDGGHEQLWISAFGAGLWRLEEGGLRSWTMESGDLPTNSTYTLVRSEAGDGESVVWAGSRAGLLRIYKNRVRAFNRSHGLPSDVVRDLTLWRSPDDVQILWLATEGGMARANADVRPWSTISLVGAQDTGVFAANVQATGDHEQLWVGAQGDGLSLFNDGQWRQFGVADGLPAPSVSMVKRTTGVKGGQTLWAGFAGGALMRILDGPELRKVPVPWPTSAGQTILDIEEARFGQSDEIWVATRISGLYRQRQGTWQAMAPTGAPSQWRSTAMATQVDANGKTWLWASSAMGLLRYDGEKLRVAIGLEDLGQTELLGVTLFEDSDRSVLWLGSSDGITRVDVTDPEHPLPLPNDLPAPPDPFVYDAQRDSQGRIYLCTNNGVQQLVYTAGEYRSRVFTRRDGMPHDECNTNARFIDAHDRYWTGTLGGLGVYDPAVERTDRQAKPLKVTGVWINDEPVDPANIELGPSRSNLQVKFALLSWQDNDRSEFRTQLLGDEAKPTSWTSSNQRSFTHLPPGSFTLRIEARDYAGNLSQPLELKVTVKPAWWQSPLAKIGSILVALLAMYLVWQWRIRAFKGQRRQLEQKVALRTQELNQANARLMELSFSDPLTGLANRRKFHQVLDGIVKRGQSQPCSLIFVDVDHFKEYNDQFGHPAGDEALRAVAAAMLECAPDDALLVRYGGEEFACLLPGFTRTHAYGVAECMRTKTQARRVPVPGRDEINRVTISAGVAELVIRADADAHALLRNADMALYAAKAAGRNCIRESS